MRSRQPFGRAVRSALCTPGADFSCIGSGPCRVSAHRRIQTLCPRPDARAAVGPISHAAGDRGPPASGTRGSGRPAPCRCPQLPCPALPRPGSRCSASPPRPHLPDERRSGADNRSQANFASVGPAPLDPEPRIGEKASVLYRRPDGPAGIPGRSAPSSSASARSACSGHRPRRTTPDPAETASDRARTGRDRPTGPKRPTGPERPEGRPPAAP